MEYLLHLRRGHSLATSKIVTAYDYTDEDGALLFQIVRFDPKDFLTRRPDGEGGWIWGLEGTQPVLYRLPDVIQSNIVVILEGEKDVETAIHLKLPVGWAATSNPFGACQWRAEYSEILRGKGVIICPDNDQSGKAHLIKVGLSLRGKATGIRVLKLPAEVKDLTEWVETGGQAERFALLLQQAQPFDYPLNDAELKKNIQPLVEALDKLLQLRGILYEWKEPEKQGNLTGPQMGLLAQEVEVIFPEWVDVDTSGYKTLSIRGFEALAIEAFRALKAENEALKARCQTLEAGVEVLAEKQSNIPD